MAAEKFYFGGVNGITSFYSSALSNIKDTPVLNVTKFMANDSVLSRRRGGKPGGLKFL